MFKFMDNVSEEGKVLAVCETRGALNESLNALEGGLGVRPEVEGVGG